MVTTVLQKRGFGVVTAGNGKEAFDRALKERPDLIISDVMMPAMDGWQLVSQLRQRREFATTPVIFLTALGGEFDRSQKYAPADYLPKPFRFEELDQRVALALKTRPEAAPAAEPLPPPTPASGGIQGSLKQLGLPSLLTMLEMDQKSGILILQREGETVRLFVRRGRVLAARGDKEPKDGRPVIYALLRWKDGRFDFNSLDVDMEDSINSSMTHLLMEGARLMDEENA